MKTEIRSNIQNIRDLEDCIRITKKYTEYIMTMANRHPIQGQDIPTRLFTKHYEVYPDIDTKVDMSMDIIKAIELLGNMYPSINIKFVYDYRDNKAQMIIQSSNGSLKKLCDKIPEFKDKYNTIVNNDNKTS